MHPRGCNLVAAAAPGGAVSAQDGSPSFSHEPGSVSAGASSPSVAESPGAAAEPAPRASRPPLPKPPGGA
eukprot:7413510-Pyramimonas_sp.AAC.1